MEDLQAQCPNCEQTIEHARVIAQFALEKYEATRRLLLELHFESCQGHKYLWTCEDWISDQIYERTAKTQ